MSEPSIKSVTPTEARANLFRLVEETANHGGPLLIAGKHARVVMVSEEDWNDIQETLHLSSQPGFTEYMHAVRGTASEDMVPLEDVPLLNPALSDEERERQLATASRRLSELEGCPSQACAKAGRESSVLRP